MALQFRLRTLFLATLYAACLVTWVKWNWPNNDGAMRWLTYLPPMWGIVACGVMLASGAARLFGAAASTCWTWLLCGATIALASHVVSIFDAFSCMGYCNECDYRDQIAFNRVQSLTLPMAVFAPVSFALLLPIVGRLPRGDRWATIAVAFAMGNVLLLNVLLMVCFSLVCDLRHAEGRARYMAYQLNAHSETPSQGCGCTSLADETNR